MAIQFHCPSCQAMIRVPDAAAGKKGTCPRCHEKLLVPDVVGTNPSPLEESESSTVAPGLPKLDSFPDLTAPSTSNAATTGPQLELPKLDAGTSSSIAYELQRKSRAKRKPGLGTWIVPVLCVLGVVGFLAWYMWTSQPKLEGALVAHTVHDLEVQPGLIPGALSGLKADDLGEVLRHLQAEPAHWASSNSKMTLTGTDDGVEVSIRNGPDAHFVSVSPSQSPVLAGYIQQHFDELERARLASIQKHAPRLFAAWKQQFDKHHPISDQKTHRDSVVLPALVSGLGYHLEAFANGNVYPCVHEGADGTLYFLLPIAAKSFVLQGRKLAGGPHVPANFAVKLAGSASASTVRKKGKRKTAEERESENEGMNPDLDKSEPSKTSQDEGEALRMGLGDMLSDKPLSSTTKAKSSSKK